MPTPGPSLQAASLAEFRRLIDEALAELDDLQDVLHFDAGLPEGQDSFLDRLRRSLQALRRRAAADDYPFGGGELDFMPLVRETPMSLLPCKHLLLRIDETHRRGLRPPP